MSVAIMLAMFLAGPLFYKASYEGASKALVLLVRATTIVIGIYTLVAGVVIPPGLEGLLQKIAATETVWRITIAIWTFAAIFKPSFAFAPLLSAIVAKSVSGAALSLPRLSGTDYLAVVEVGFIGAIGVVVTSLLARVAQNNDPESVDSINRRHHDITVFFFFVAIAAHFANYFYSGLAKIMLDGAAPWTWALFNPTWMLAEITTFEQISPLSHIPIINNFLIDAYTPATPVANTIILIGQLAAVVVLLNRQATLLLVAFYDITHIVIFLVSGIFFWKWIILNAVIVYCVAYMRNQDFARFGLAGCGFVLAAPLVFHIVWLGWYETPMLNKHKIWSITESGEKYQTPSNYFSIASITAAQSRLGTPEGALFPTGTFGTTSKGRWAFQSWKQCETPKMNRGRYARGEDEIKRTIRRFHSYALSKVDENGQISYDFYPHHIWSNLWLFEPFRELDKRLIVAYEIEVQPYCLVGPNDVALDASEFSRSSTSPRFIEMGNPITFRIEIGGDLPNLDIKGE